MRRTLLAFISLLLVASAARGAEPPKAKSPAELTILEVKYGIGDN